MTPDATDLAMARISLDQSRADREARRVERSVVSLCGGDGMFARVVPQDLAAARRASAAFGLTGGELCGCHERGCETCASNFGCGVQGCGTCIGFGWQDVGPRGPAPPTEGLGLATPSPTHEFGSVPTNAQLIDSHAHLMCSEVQPWTDDASKFGAIEAKAEADERIVWLQLAQEYGVAHMVNADGSLIEKGVDEWLGAIPGYRDFLSRAQPPLTAENKELILWGNAFRILHLAEGPSTWDFR